MISVWALVLIVCASSSNTVYCSDSGVAVQRVANFSTEQKCTEAAKQIMEGVGSRKRPLYIEAYCLNEGSALK